MVPRLGIAGLLDLTVFVHFVLAPLPPHVELLYESECTSGQGAKCHLKRLFRARLARLAICGPAKAHAAKPSRVSHARRHFNGIKLP